MDTDPTVTPDWRTFNPTYTPNVDTGRRTAPTTQHKAGITPSGQINAPKNSGTPRTPDRATIPDSEPLQRTETRRPEGPQGAQIPPSIKTQKNKKNK